MELHDLNIRKLIYFRELARTEHLTNTATKLHIAPPALKAMMNRLEQVTGGPLFDRKGRNIALNARGREFLRHVDIILNEIKILESYLSLENDKYRKIRIGASNPNACNTVMPLLIREFPNNFFEYSVLRIEQFEDEEEIEKYDLLFAAEDDIYSSKWNYCKLLCQQPCLVVPENHFLAGQKAISISNVATLPLIFLSKGYSFRRFVDTLFSSEGLTPNIIAECDYNVISVLLHENIGVTVSNPSSEEWQQYSGAKYIHIFGVNCKRIFCIFWKKSNEQDLTVQKIANLIISIYGSYESSDDDLDGEDLD